MTAASPSPSSLARFHRVLVERIREVRGGAFRAPISIAEIYQELVPYRTHRDAVGARLNGDYEDALLRLLAGEGGYLLLQSPNALQAIQRELELPHPNTAIYRAFAAADVLLNPERIPVGISTAAPPAAGSPEAPELPPETRPERGITVDLVAELPEREPARPEPPKSEPSESERVDPRLAAFLAESSAPPLSAPEKGPSSPAADSRPGADPGPLGESRGARIGVSRGGDAEEPLREENARLRKIVADQALELHRLREALGERRG